MWQEECRIVGRYLRSGEKMDHARVYEAEQNGAVSQGRGRRAAVGG